MSLINYKVHLELNWIEDCILFSAGKTAKFAIADAKLHVFIVTLYTNTMQSWRNNQTKDLNDLFIEYVEK